MIELPAHMLFSGGDDSIAHRLALVYPRFDTLVRVHDFNGRSSSNSA